MGALSLRTSEGGVGVHGTRREGVFGAGVKGVCGASDKFKIGRQETSAAFQRVERDEEQDEPFRSFSRRGGKSAQASVLDVLDLTFLLVLSLMPSRIERW